MPEQVNDPFLTYFSAGTILLSLGICFVLLVARTQGPLLAFRPRRPVPWNAAGALLACALVLLVVASTLQRLDAPTNDADPSAEQSGSSRAVLLVEQIAAPTILVGLTLFFIVAVFKPTLCDLGLPTSRRELAEDVTLGIIVGLAALAPILIAQLVLMWWLGLESGHDLVKLLREGKPDAFVFTLAALAAVVFAPVTEEITFRLLLQGWLEKWETEAVATPVDDCPITNDEGADNPDVSVIETRDPVLAEPPQRGLAGLPFGWLPIIVSSLLFGLAHMGYGPEPLPLFLLALIFGYVYHCTHRIVPSIVAHAVFNAFTIVSLWRMVFYGAE
jgi:membrane protease YdiL (CAAX protease family)